MKDQILTELNFGHLCTAVSHVQISLCQISRLFYTHFCLPFAFQFAEMPVVEKLQLTELMVSSVDEQDEEELEKFKELKNRMMLLERAELRSVAQSDKTPKIGPCPVSKR